jgi:hypothetical protein
VVSDRIRNIKKGKLMENKIQELAQSLKDNWIQNYTLSGRLAFQKCEAEKWAILGEAESLGIRDEVYTLANKIMKGEA